MHQFYPSTFELEQKVDMIQAYISAPHESNSIFRDLLPFVKSVESDLEKIRKIDKLLSENYLNKEIETKLIASSNRIRNKLLTCFQYFESGHQIYLRGTYADFSTDHQYGMSYLGNIKTILKVLNYIVFKTFKNLDYNWDGFITFSNFLTYLTAEASIIVLPFFRKNSVEFINYWMLISHEMGHVYYWDYFRKHDEYRLKKIDTWFHKLLDEIIADIFSLEQGYALDIIHYCNDFDRVRRHYQDPRNSRFFRDTYHIRKIAALLYCCARANADFARAISPFLSKESSGKYPIINAINNLRSEMTKIVHSVSAVNINIEYVDKFIEYNFINGALGSIKSWYTSDRNSYGTRNTEEVERIFLNTIVNFAHGKQLDQKKTHISSEYILARDNYSFVKEIANGSVVDAQINQPLLFLKELIDFCDTSSIRLDEEINAKIRAAAIFSIYNEAVKEERK